MTLFALNIRHYPSNLRSFATVIGLTVVAVWSSTPHASGHTDAAQGRAIVLDTERGNCIACHSIKGANYSGNIAPPLIAIQIRYPYRKQLRQMIWDPTINNPQTVMPPYGRHQILTEDEIDKVTAFIYNL
jgi:L-cysteine S-thiosulfotransferase